MFSGKPNIDNSSHVQSFGRGRHGQARIKKRTKQSVPDSFIAVSGPTYLLHRYLESLSLHAGRFKV